MANFKYLTLTFVLTVFISTIWMSTNRHSANKYINIFNWDSEGYYLYLPAIFINNGFEHLATKTTNENGDRIFQKFPGTEKVFTKYTCGVSLLSLPFFLAAHAWVIVTETDPNAGFAPPYAIAMIVSVAFYLSLGLYFLLLVLNQHFSQTTSLLTCLIVWLGTNLLCYSALLPGFAHPFSFCLGAMFIYFTRIYYEKKRPKYLLILAFTLGLLTLLRPTNMLYIIYFLCFEVHSISTIQERIKKIGKDWKGVLFFPVALLICYIPQLLYWNYISGHWFIYSYGNEGFTRWNHPMLPEIWYHPLNGLFLYEPLLLFSLLGIMITWKNRTINSRWILLIFLLISYISASWWFWTFGTSYGYRPIIDFLPLLAIPIAAAIDKGTSSIFKIPMYLLILFLLFVSVRMNFTYLWRWQGADWGWNDVLNCYINAILLR